MDKFVKSKWFVVSLLSVFIVGIVAGNLLWRMNYLFNHVTGGYKEYHTDRPLSLLILGNDKRGDYGGDLTDVMMLAIFNPQEKTIRLLSIPRDTRVIIPGENLDRKINSVVKRGEELKEEAIRKGEKPTTDGISLLKKTIESIYGIPVDHYVMINFDSFRQTIDQLGGIEVNVDKRLLYHDPTDGTAIDLYPGLQTLNGEQALGFVRHRHDDRGVEYYSTDYERNERQQMVIQAVLTKIKTFTGMTKILDILKVVGKNTKTDLSVYQIRGLIGDFATLDKERLISLVHEGAYWVPALSRTLIPIETLNNLRKILLQAMNLEEKVVSRYNDSPAGVGLSWEKTDNPNHIDMNPDADDVRPAPDVGHPHDDNSGGEPDPRVLPEIPIIIDDENPDPDPEPDPEPDEQEPPEPNPPSEEEPPSGEAEQGAQYRWLPI